MELEPCDHCGEWLNITDMVLVEDGSRYICLNCADTQIKICNSCGLTGYVPDGLIDNNGNGFICKECLRKEEEHG